MIFSLVSLINGKIGQSQTTVGMPASCNFFNTATRSLVVLTLGSIFLHKFSSQVEKVAEQNENPIFKIQKILIYSSANAIDKSENESLQDLSILQYSDIAITIDNTSTVYDLTNENTVKDLYIDNISITTGSDKGHQYVNYKSALDFAKYKEIEERNNDKIEYHIVTTNEENNKTDYGSPTFYADCSNPITLEYINQDIITNYAASSDSNTISFNGKVLQEAGIDLNDINYTLNFTIHIVNNLNEEFICPVRLRVDLSGNDGGIYKGEKNENISVSGYEYNFIKIVK